MDIVPMSPITSVKLLSNVPLDSSYKDTLNFSDVSSQYNFFNGKTKYTFDNMTPVKLQNAVRIPKKADDLYDCNYIMFKNANFSNKWFYAFITKINYISTNMCTVEFLIDVMQTWQFDITLKPSFVVREHTNDDTIGSNLVTENLELGEYISEGMEFTGLIDRDFVIVVATTADQTGADVTGGTYAGIYSGLKLIAFTDPATVNTMIATLTSQNKASAIVAIFMMPSSFVTVQGDLPAHHPIAKYKKLDNIDGYMPKNNKLFTHPFTFMYVTNLQGNSAIYPYEYFEDPSDCTFEVVGDMSCNPQVVLYPSNYKGVSYNYNEKIVLDGFPQCAYNTDSFQAWLAQNGASTAVSVLGTALTLGAGVATANPIAIGAGIASAVSVANTVAKIYTASTLPPQAHGASGSSANMAMGIKDFAFMRMSIRDEYAKIIDDYFSMFGYATHRVKIPNTTGRPSWNYVKTIDCKIVGNVPFEDITKIKSVYDNGVTFWHGDYVGDYTRNNQLGGV